MVHALNQRPMLSIVVPVYNEEDTVGKFLKAIRDALAAVTEDYEIIFVADPCTDRTVDMLRDEHARDGRIKILVFSRRFGQPAATWGGLSFAQGRGVVVIDCDLQDPPGLIPEMVRRWREGYKVVIPQRRSRKGETLLKRVIAYLGYKFINKICSVPIPRNTGDFRLLDRVVVDELMKLNESHGFLRGLTGVVGFKTCLLPFDREARAGGKGKYNRLTGSLRIGFNGIVAFSDYLLNLMVAIGFAMASLAVVAMAVIAYLKASGTYDFAAGLATVAMLVLLLTGVQFIGMGILGAYIGRIYDESKRRPKFIVEEQVGWQAPEDPGHAAGSLT
ncbi:MAG: glycosyltransferase family 2 protein [Thermoguttaceae bacterium]|jgi:dolichol-phosphate mannosyltransferase